MSTRIITAPLLLGAAIAIPYVSTHGPEAARKFFNQSAPAEAQPQPAVPEIPPAQVYDSAPRGPGYEIYPVTTPLEGRPSMALEDIFRFDVTKEWVYERWARKSTALAELGLYGVRVPLVTGTQIYDLAGSLTYFFDANGTVQRISFTGQTGDTTRIIALATQRYGLQPQVSVIAGQQLLQYKRGTDVISELSTEPSSVLWSSSPHDSFTVDLQLQRPEAITPLPSRLPPLPVVKAAEQPAAEATAKDAPAAAGEEKKSFHDSFKAFFPRSKVPSEQVENLEKRDRYW